MQQASDKFCTFCKQGDAKLVTHSLCRCCLMNLEPTSVVPTEDVVRNVECNVCLGEYQEDELHLHRMMCMPRWVFRCAVCDGDYLSKEALWNHLALHEIANERKELHCQENRITYKQLQCMICNDQRCYPENFYWRHVHEDHDGFFLRCSGCGENFRSQKHKTDHTLNHCKNKESIEPSESDELDVYGVTTLNKQHLSHAQEGICEVRNIESTKASLSVQQNSLGSKLDHSSSGDIQENDSALVTDSDHVLTNYDKIVDDTDNGAQSNETDEASEESLPAQEKDPSAESSGVRCPHCDKRYANVRNLTQHIGYSHKPATCDICGLFFSSGNKALYHKRTSHSKKKYKCSECSKEFLLKTTYQRHLFTHQVERKFLCKECGSTFKTSGDLNRHTRIVHTRYENLQVKINSNSKTPEPKQSKVKKIAKIDCPVCRESFNDHKKVSQHIQEIHEKFICTICKVTFTSSHELTEHKCTICSDCGKECYHQLRLESHIKLCHQLIKCDVCETFIPGESQLVLHKLKVHGEPRYKCPNCSKKFHLKQAYERHMVRYSKIKKVQCEFCDRRFKTPLNVIMHMKKYHGVKKTHKDLKQKNSQHNGVSSEQQDETEFKLESIVEVGETTLQEPDNHSEYSSSIEKVADNKNKEVARMDSSMPLRSSKSKRKNRKQISRAIGEIPLTKPSDTVCPHCGKECYHKSRLINHISWGHDLTDCDVCGITLTGRTQVWYHKLTTHTEPKFKCSKCPLKFHLKNTYQRHVSTHDKYSKVHPCKSCGGKFKTSAQLSRHTKQMHFNKKGQSDSAKLKEELEAQKVKIKMEASEEKSSLPCPHCDKKFHQEYPLTRHVKSNHVPTSCEICGIAFDNKHQLGYHKRTIHVEPKYECPHCSQKFHMKTSFENHVKRHGTNKFPCKFCSLMFKSALSTSIHIRKAHLGRKGQTKGKNN